MIVGTYAFSQAAFGTLPDAADRAVANPLRNLLSGVDIELQYLIELTPFDAAKNVNVLGSPFGVHAISEYPEFSYTGAETVVYLSDRGFFTGSSENPAHTSYLPLVDNPFQFEVSILSGDEFRGGNPAFGAIRIHASDGYLDDIVDYFWTGRTVTLYVGGKEFQRSEFDAVFRGIISGIEFDEEDIIINISDKTNILSTSFVQKLYQGTGGVEGNDDISGDVKPLCYGEVKNVPLKLVDAATNLYQVHDGSIEEVTAVYDRGVELNNQGDVADITATTVSGGNFKTQLSGGYIRLGGNPDGTITADVKGDNTGGYIDKAGAILSRLVQTKLGGDNFGSNDINQASLNVIDVDLPDNVGFYIDQKTQLDAVLNNLFISLNAYWIFDRQGRITARLIDAPSDSVLTIDQNQILDNTFECIETIPAAWRITAGYGKNWQVQTADNIAASATDAQNEFAIADYRLLVSENRNVRGQTKNAKEVRFNSLLLDQADAQDYLDRLERIYQTRRQVYRFTAVDLLFKVFVGDVITLKYPRYGLDSGKDFLITSIAEDAQDNETIFEVWG